MTSRRIASVLRPRARAPVAAALALACAWASSALAQSPPAPLGSELWPFPSTFAAPTSARSAGVAMADRWLGEQPFDNPAARLARGVSAGGLLEHISRQDLSSGSRDYSEEGAFVDFGGAWLALPLRRVSLVAYAAQPLLRLESNAFTRGELGAPQPPAQITSSGTTRELRAGLGVSTGCGAFRLGVAGEYLKRSDSYEQENHAETPDQGVQHVDFSGDGFGGQAGVTWGRDDTTRFATVLGLAVRWVPALTVDGTQSSMLLSGDSTGPVSSDRESGLDAGLSASFRTSRTFRVIAGGGARSARAWPGFGAHPGQSYQWALGGEFHDSRDPWTVRFGGGQEQEPDVVEYRSGLVGVGLSWNYTGAVLDLGLLHRTLARADKPISYDDRVLATVTVAF